MSDAQYPGGEFFKTIVQYSLLDEDLVNAVLDEVGNVKKLTTLEFLMNIEDTSARLALAQHANIRRRDSGKESRKLLDSMKRLAERFPGYGVKVYSEELRGDVSRDDVIINLDDDEESGSFINLFLNQEG